MRIAKGTPISGNYTHGADMKALLKGRAMYLLITLLASALLLWGWSLALKNLINGTTVVS